MPTLNTGTTTAGNANANTPAAGNPNAHKLNTGASTANTGTHNASISNAGIPNTGHPNVSGTNNGDVNIGIAGGTTNIDANTHNPDGTPIQKSTPGIFTQQFASNFDYAEANSAAPTPASSTAPASQPFSIPLTMPPTPKEQKALLSQILAAMQGMTPLTPTNANSLPSAAAQTAPASKPASNTPAPNASTPWPDSSAAVMTNLQNRQADNLANYQIQTKYFTVQSTPPPGTWIELNGSVSNISSNRSRYDSTHR